MSDPASNPAPGGDESGPGNLAEVARLALKLGLTAFGGPAAHIAMLRREAVTNRKWLTDARFLDLLGVTNLIPGPNSTELVMHVGRERAGMRGLVAAGAAFIVPAFGMTLGLAWLYVEYGTTAAGTDVLWAVKPVVLAIVAQAIWGLSRIAVKGWMGAIVIVAVAALYLLGVNELVLLLGAGVLASYPLHRWREWRPAGSFALAPLGFGGLLGAADNAGVPYSTARLFWTFAKIGSVLYGSGYVLLAFLRGDFVERYGWLTEQQLLDAVAAGQVTPGPVFTTATFAGFIMGGWWGAVVATAGIFLPAFIFVGLTYPFVHRIRRRPRLAALLDGVNLAALGLMAAVSLVLARGAIVDLWTTAIFAAAAVVLVRYRLNSTWPIAVAVLAGLIRWRLA